MDGFVIHIIESPSQENLLDGVEEGAALQACFRQMGILSERFLAVTPAMMEEAVQRILGMHVAGGTYEGHAPILHLSCHGNKGGIGFTSQATVNWPTLGEVIRPLNDLVDGNLLLGMSACEGFHGLEMAKSIERPPFGILFGPKVSVLWKDSMIAFLALYHLFTKQIPTGIEEFADLVGSVNLAAGVPSRTFDGVVGPLVRKEYLRDVVRGALAGPQQKRAHEVLAALQAARAATRGQP